MSTYVYDDMDVINSFPTNVLLLCRNMIVGDRPFQSFTSVLGISLFVLISSQLLGNVAVIQLAVPNIQPLPEVTLSVVVQ